MNNKCEAVEEDKKGKFDWWKNRSFLGVQFETIFWFCIILVVKFSSMFTTIIDTQHSINTQHSIKTLNFESECFLYELLDNDFAVHKTERKCQTERMLD